MPASTSTRAAESDIFFTKSNNFKAALSPKWGVEECAERPEKILLSVVCDSEIDFSLLYFCSSKEIGILISTVANPLAAFTIFKSVGSPIKANLGFILFLRINLRAPCIPVSSPNVPTKTGFKFLKDESLYSYKAFSLHKKSNLTSAEPSP